MKQEISKAKINWTSSKLQNTKGLWAVVKETSNKDKRNVLSGLLKHLSFYTRSCGTDKREADGIPDHGKTWTPNFDSMITAKMLLHLKPEKAAGSDHLSPRLLRNAAFELYEPLTHIMTLSFDANAAPSPWNIALKVMPIPKKANPSIDNLRPLSLLPTFSKILEKIALNAVKLWC